MNIFVMDYSFYDYKREYTRHFVDIKIETRYHVSGSLNIFSIGWPSEDDNFEIF